MSRNWSRYEGQFAGGWRLDSFLGERDGRAFFMGHDGVGPKSVLVEVMAADAPGADAALASWSIAKKFTHGDLMHVRAAGDYELENGERLVYGVLELPDDDLSEMLPRRPLEEAEVRGMLAAAAHALDYLHEEGVTHGAVLPANIFVIGDAWRLSVDSLTPANDERRGRDVRQLGATLVWVLTGGADDPTRMPSPESVASLDLPWRDIAIGCLNKGWSATQVVAALEGRYAPPDQAQTPPPADTRPEQRNSAVAGASTQKARSNTWPVVTALLAVLVLVLAYVLSGKGTPDATPSPAAALPPPKTEAAKAERPIVQNTSATTTQAGSADREVAPRNSTHPWAVVAATYGRRSDAEKRARLIRARWRQFHAQVYPTDRESGAFFVVLGSGLSRDAANALQRRARSAGVAGDSYATKLNTTARD